MLGIAYPFGKRKQVESLILFSIAALASIFYFYQLGWPDIITDESSYATRAIGLVDFDFGIEQPTPWQWVDKIPWWMWLSFHDHPPLVFLLQHYSIKLFGENPTAIRIPSAMAGTASVIFLYFIGKQLYSPAVGAISSLLFAVTANHVWISRIGLQESILIALMLAGFYCFLRALGLRSVLDPASAESFGGQSKLEQYASSESRRRRDESRSFFWLLLTGFLLGLAFLAKYLALILIPIFITLTILQRNAFAPRTKFYFLFSIFLFLVVVSPVVIYNIQLYKNFGHFDFQFSLLFGQDVSAWQSRPGQEVLGSYASRIQNFIPWLIDANSPYFLLLAAFGLIAILWQTIRNSWRSHGVIILAFALLLWFLVFIGPAPRFLTILTPWLALAAGYGLAALGDRLKRSLPHTAPNVIVMVIVIVATIEAVYAYSSIIALDPVGAKPWAYSHLRRQSHSWGFNELNISFDEKLKGKMPDPAITFEFLFAREILDRAATVGKAEGRQAVPWAIVYDGNINLSAQLWVFLRRIVYQGWPVADAETFRRGGAQEFFRDSGVKTIFFVAATDFALKDRPRLPAPDADSMEAELIQRGIKPDEIRNARGEIVFRIYQFELK